MTSTQPEHEPIGFDEGWEYMKPRINKLIEGLPDPHLSSEDYVMIYTTIYDMCNQKVPHDHSQKLYNKYKEVFYEYIVETVLPSLKEKQDELLLRDFVHRWINHNVMVRWLSKLFNYVGKFFIVRMGLPALKVVGLTLFRDLVYQELKGKIKRDREGELIDRVLVKNITNIFVEIGVGEMTVYESDFEEPMLKDSAAYYSEKASNWILGVSCPDYMLEAEKCLKLEKDRVAHYLHSSSEEKLLEKVQHELLSVYATQLFEKERSGCLSLLKDEKVEDLSRMYRLFSLTPRGLEPASSSFEQSGEQSSELLRHEPDDMEI